MISAQNVRLAKSIYKGNDLDEIIEYSYTPDGKIQKVKLSQNGKIFSTTTDFVFNNAGLVISYITTFNPKISPQKTTITYDDKNRISTLTDTKTQNNKVQKSRTFNYNGNITTVTSPGNASYKNNYIFNDNGDIIKEESVGSPSSASTTLYDGYDFIKNPLTMTGGYVDESPLSKHNNTKDNYIDIFEHNRELIYSKKIVQTYKPGGPKIPTSYKNDLLIKAIETSFNKDYNKVMPVSTTTYDYINLK